LLLRPFKTLPEPLFVPLLEEMAAPKPVPKVLLFTQALVFPKDRPCPGPLMLTGNGNVQLMVGSWDALELGADSNVTINGGTYSGSNTVEPAILINGDNAYVTSANINGPGQGLSLGKTSACVNNNTFGVGTGLGSAIYSNSTTNRGSGNVLNGLNSNLTPGTCVGP